MSDKQTDELVQVIVSASAGWDEPLDEVHDARPLATAILAHGYRTMEDLQADIRLEKLLSEAPESVPGGTLEKIFDELKILRYQNVQLVERLDELERTAFKWLPEPVEARDE